MCVCPTLCDPMDPTPVTPWTVAHQVPFTHGISQARYYSRLPFSPPGDLSDLGTNPVSPAGAGGCFATSATWEFSRNLLRWVCQEGNEYFRLSREGHAKPGETYSLLQHDMVICKLKKWFNTNRRQQSWIQSAHPVRLAEDKFCVCCIRVDSGTEGTSAWILSQDRHKQNLSRSSRCSNLPNWCLV